MSSYYRSGRRRRKTNAITFFLLFAGAKRLTATTGTDEEAGCPEWDNSMAISMRADHDKLVLSDRSGDQDVDRLEAREPNQETTLACESQEEERVGEHC